MREPVTVTSSSCAAEPWSAAGASCANAWGAQDSVAVNTQMARAALAERVAGRWELDAMRAARRIEATAWQAETIEYSLFTMVCYRTTSRGRPLETGMPQE
jgi:hypothetical protein